MDLLRTQLLWPSIYGIKFTELRNNLSNVFDGPKIIIICSLLKDIEYNYIERSNRRLIQPIYLQKQLNTFTIMTETGSQKSKRHYLTMMSNNVSKYLSYGITTRIVNNVFVYDINKFWSEERINKYRFSRYDLAIMLNTTTILDVSNPGNTVIINQLDRLSDIKSLNLFSLNVVAISDYAFYSLANLRFLNLASNNISRINYYSFIGLVNLEVLNLDNNTISTITDGMLDYLPKIKHLILSRNIISSVSKAAFSSNTLITINLQFNLLSYIDPGTFNNLNKLKKVNLSNNNISIKHTY